MDRRLPLAIMAAITSAMATTSPAFAHSDGHFADSIWHGLIHPVTGWDHLVAMVAVGLWGAFLGTRAILLLPLIFPAVMAVGAVAAFAGLSIPGVEIGIPASAIVLGLAVALAACPPFWVAATIVGVFAIFHGHAHGAELPTATNPVAYAIGFVTSTMLLHWFGILFGLAARWDAGRLAVRATGAAVAVVGFIFITRSLGA